MFMLNASLIEEGLFTVNLEMKSKIEGGTIFICTQTASLNGIVSSDGAVDYSGLD